jgi:hypothetical protein
MKTYILINENFESISCGTDQLVIVDGRFNAWSILQAAKKHVNSFQKYMPAKYEALNKASYLALFEGSVYSNGKYLYKKGLINFKY